MATDDLRIPGFPQHLSISFIYSILLSFMTVESKKSPTGPTERTPKPEYLIALVTSLGLRW